MAGPARSFFDTNVLVYLYDADEPEKRARAIELFARHRANDEVVVSTQVLLEFYAVVARRFARAIPAEKARREVELLAELDPVQVSVTLILAAIDRSRKSKISIWDASIVEAALKSGCTTLYSEDLQDGWVVDGRLRVVNPFAAGT